MKQVGGSELRRISLLPLLPYTSEGSQLTPGSQAKTTSPGKRSFHKSGCENQQGFCPSKTEDCYKPKYSS